MNLSLQYDKSQVLACSYVLSNEVVVASCLFLEIHIPECSGALLHLLSFIVSFIAVKMC